LIELVNQAGNRDKQQQQCANFREAHAITPSPGHLHQKPEAPWEFPFVIEW